MEVIALAALVAFGAAITSILILSSFTAYMSESAMRSRTCSSGASAKRAGRMQDRL